jgi:hypothetical protein
LKYTLGILQWQMLFKIFIVLQIEMDVFQNFAPDFRWKGTPTEAEVCVITNNR